MTEKTKGLKQMVEEAMSEAVPVQPVQPVQVSDDAHRALAIQMRTWSGWSDARLELTYPSKRSGGMSGSGLTEWAEHRFTINVDRLLLNPYRVLFTVTPFRLKQEAPLTGVMLHEAGHVRFTHWKPRTAEARAALRHGNGDPVADATLSLAALIEEPRVEAFMALNAHRAGAQGLEWTMRASAAHVLPHRPMLDANPNQGLMDFIQQWVLQAGRQIALNATTGFEVRHWAVDFTTALHEFIKHHLERVDPHTAAADAARVVNRLTDMLSCQDHKGTTLIDWAKEVLDLLFPETPEDERPQPEQPQCGDGGSGGDGDGSGEDEESESESGDDGEGDDEGDDEGEGDEGDGEPEPTEREESEAEREESEAEREFREEMERVLREMREASQQDSAEEAKAGMSTAPEQGEGGENGEAYAPADLSEEYSPHNEDSTTGLGAGGPGSMGGGWRRPNKEERGIQDRAEHFLRRMIAPSESSKRVLTDTPSSMVDGAALTAWKASGGTRDPRFFIRTNRTVEPTPPIKVAILVDVSGSMDEMQRPSSILSWALTAAAMDLRNFAGRGQQIETCLIHWGTTSRVVQRPGQTLPGIREVPCIQGTSAMGRAFQQIEDCLPGFFDVPAEPEHRLLVQFTDWDMWGGGWDLVKKFKAMGEAGVNMLSVVPDDWHRSSRRGSRTYRSLIDQMKVRRGTTSMLRYNPSNPGEVWDKAAEVLC